MMSKANVAAESVLDFWFNELTPADWYKNNTELDQRIRQQFGAALEQAQRNELFLWRQSSEGRLAEIILLDQFSRNLFRGSAAAFSQDPQALALAQEAVAQGFDQRVPPIRRAFFYLPYMHSESLQVHETALYLFKQLGLGDNLEYEIKHKEIIEKFGRYPHRNEALGRISTQAELAFLATHPGF